MMTSSVGNECRRGDAARSSAWAPTLGRRAQFVNAAASPGNTARNRPVILHYLPPAPPGA